MKKGGMETMTVGSFTVLRTKKLRMSRCMVFKDNQLCKGQVFIDSQPGAGTELRVIFQA
jgi:hypothetical protein